VNASGLSRSHTRAAQPGGITQAVHSVLAVMPPTEPGGRTFQRNLIPKGDGVSTYLALTFGTLLSSQGTEASFTATVLNQIQDRPLRAFPSAFPAYQIFSDPIPASGIPARAFPAHSLGRSDEVKL
jgi:hypothetical protein